MMMRWGKMTFLEPFQVCNFRRGLKLVWKVLNFFWVIFFLNFNFNKNLQIQQKNLKYFREKLFSYHKQVQMKSCDDFLVFNPHNFFLLQIIVLRFTEPLNNPHVFYFFADYHPIYLENGSCVYKHYSFQLAH